MKLHLFSIRISQIKDFVLRSVICLRSYSGREQHNKIAAHVQTKRRERERVNE